MKRGDTDETWTPSDIEVVGRAIKEGVVLDQAIRIAIVVEDRTAQEASSALQTHDKWLVVERIIDVEEEGFDPETFRLDHVLLVA